jgi:hypothetical protein
VRTLDALQAHVHGHFCDLVFRLDEMGVSEWEDRKSKKLLFRWIWKTVYGRIRIETNGSFISDDTLLRWSTRITVTGPSRDKSFALRSRTWGMDARTYHRSLIVTKNKTHWLLASYLVLSTVYHEI